MTPAQSCRIATAVLDVIAERQERPARTPPILVIVLQLLVTAAKSSGVQLEAYRKGPWTAEWLEIAGHRMPVVRNGAFAMIEYDQAADTAAFLNWCHVPEPVLASLR